jgi:predicted small secreted protein
MNELLRNRLVALAILALPLLVAACNSGGGGGAPGY